MEPKHILRPASGGAAIQSTSRITHFAAMCLEGHGVLINICDLLAFADAVGIAHVVFGCGHSVVARGA